MSGCERMCSVIVFAKPTRSTARAPPAATRFRSAESIMSEPSRRSSSLSRPTALVSSSLRREFEHTSSAKYGETCAGVIFSGFISMRRTGMPRLASCQAHSLPASPAPTTVTLSNGVLTFRSLRSSRHLFLRNRPPARRCLSWRGGGIPSCPPGQSWGTPHLCRTACAGPFRRA